MPCRLPNCAGAPARGKAYCTLACEQQDQKQHCLYKILMVMPVVLALLALKMQFLWLLDVAVLVVGFLPTEPIMALMPPDLVNNLTHYLDMLPGVSKDEKQRLALHIVTTVPCILSLGLLRMYIWPIIILSLVGVLWRELYNGAMQTPLGDVIKQILAFIEPILVIRFTGLMLGEQPMFTLVERDSAEWGALATTLNVTDFTLGKGKDQKCKGAAYNELRLAHAWRINNRAMQREYETYMGRVATEVRAAKEAHLPTVDGRGLPTKAQSIIKAVDGDPTGDASVANEMLVLHGTTMERVLGLVRGGFDQSRINENKATGGFGGGFYFAEDLAKTDQYADVDRSYDAECELHRELFGEGNEGQHQGQLFYAVAFLAALGHPARSQHGGRNSESMDYPKQRNYHPPGTNPIPEGQKPDWTRLNPVPNTGDRHFFHSLIAELGVNIVRFREFVLFKRDAVCPRYLLAYQRFKTGALVSF